MKLRRRFEKCIFNKSFNNLNEMEVLGLHVILIAPTKYNPRMYPTKYLEKISSLIKAYN